jgi:adenosine deaminase
LLEAGIVATVNSDDPAYFGGYINQNFTETFEALGLGAPQAYQLARNSFEASFIGDARKAQFIDRLNATFESFS